MGRPTLYVVARADYDEYQKDITRIKALTKAAGKDVSDALNNAISPKQVNNGLLSLATSLKQVSRASREFNPKGVVSGLEEIAQRSGVSIKTMDSLSQAMLKTARDNSLERAFANIQKQAGLSNLEMAKLRMQFGDTAGAFKAFGAAVAPVAATIAAATASFGFMGKAALDATLEMDRLKKAYTSIMGSDKASTTQLDYIYGVTQKLGLQFQSTAEAAKGFFASSVGTPLEKDMKSIFEGVVSAGAALALSKDQISGVFIALSQIASKGKLSMEEVHQIAERFPGTFEIIAKALKVPRDELFKLIETGTVTNGMLSDLGNAWKEKYGDAAIEASKGVQGALNKLSTEWELYKASLMDSDTAVAGINAVRGALEGIKDAGEFIGDNSAGIASLGVFAAAVGAVTVARKLDIVESGKQALADAQLHGVLNTLQDRLGGVNFVEQQRIATEKALQSESVKTAQQTVESAQAELTLAQQSVKTAEVRQRRAARDKELAISTGVVTKSMLSEEVALRELNAAQALVFQKTKQLDLAQKALAVSTETTTAAFLKGSVAEKAMSGLKGAASGLVSFLGGPWGVAFTAATAGVAYLSMRQTEAEKVNKQYADVLSTAEEALKKMGIAASGASEEVIKLNRAQALVELNKAQASYASLLDEATEKVAALADQSIRLGTDLDPSVVIFNKFIASVRNGNPDFAGTATALADIADKNPKLVATLIDVVIAIEKNTNKQKDLQEQIRNTSKDARDAAGAMDDVAGAANRAGAAISAAFDPKKLEGVLQSLDIKKLFAGFDGLKLAQAQALQQAGKSAAEISKILSGELKSADTEQVLLATSAAYRAEQSKKAREEAARTAAQFAKNAEAEAKRFAESVSQYESGLNQLRNAVGAMEDALDPSLTKFERLRKQIEAEKKAAIENADVKAKEAVRRKQATAAQAQETAELEKRKAVLTATQKLDELENQNLRDKADFYKDLAEKTGKYSTSMEYQNQLLEKQRENWINMGIPVKDVQEMIRQLQLESSRDPFDGITRGLQGFISEATDGAKAMEDTFSSLFSGMDSGFKNVWQQMLEDGKVSLSSFKSLFASFLADLMHMAITRPITVQIAGAVSGMLGTGGVAYAAGGSGGSGGVGGMSNLSGLSNLMPSSWTSGIADTINNTMAGWFPSTFGATAYSGTAGTVMSATGGAADIAGLKAAEAAMLSGNTSGSGMAASQMGTFTQAVAPYLMAGGLSSLGYTMLGGALGLPQSKYSGITAGLGGAAGWGLGSLAAGSFASIGATMGSVIPVVGTIIGAIAGGALGSLFGQERKTHPSVYGHMMGLGYTTDTQTYIDAFMEQATYDRAGKTEASGYAQVIGEAASQTAGNILNLAAMLPEAYKQSVEDKLESATWSAGRGYSGASWNLQNWKEGMAEERVQEAIDDMFEQMGYGANKAFAEAGIGDLFTTFDLSTEAGFKKAQTAISAISSITTAIDQIKTPTTEAEQQAKAFVEQMTALGEAVKASGLNAAYADEMLGEYRTAYVDKYVETLEEMFNPLSQIEQQAKGYKTAIDGYVAALTTMQASEEQLAQVRGYTQDAIDSITGSLDAAFFPLSDVEQQTKATMESLLAYKAALETLGASAEELTHIDAAWGKMQSDLVTQFDAYISTTPEVVASTKKTMESIVALRDALASTGAVALATAKADVAWGKMQAGLLDKARAYVSTTPQIVGQAAAMNAEFDALCEAMLLAGNATADLTELERTRAQAVAALQAQYAESFRQTYAQRYATLMGDTNGLANLRQQASFSSELAEMEKTWGKGSLQYKQMQALQEAEAAKLRLEQAQAAADKLAQLQLEREKLVMQTSVDSSKARLDALKAEKTAAEQLKDTWESVLESIHDARLDMYQSDANLDVFGRLATAQGEFDRLYGLAIGGDAEAAKEMASVSSSLLDLRKETSTTSADYLDAFYGVDKKLKDVSWIADKQVSAADRQLAVLGSQLSVQEAQYGVLSAQLSALGSQNATLASIDAQISGLEGALSGLDSAKNGYQSALDKVNGIKPNTGVYGSNYLTEYDLLVAKVASLNATNVDGRTDWTVADARKSMIDTYGSVPEWYKNAGKIEGFAKGGLASGWGIAGEYGPELIDFSTPGRVYTAEQTRQILMPPAVGTDGSLVAEIAKLREQNKEMARELRIANARLEKMEKYAKETKDGVDEIRVVGIPVTVEV